MRHKVTLAPIIPNFGLWRPCICVNGAENNNLSLNIGGDYKAKATLAPIIPIFGLWRPCKGVNGAKNKDLDVQWCSNIFFIFLKDLFYKLSLGCNTSHYLMIFLWKLIKNSYSAIKNLKKLWLQAKFSNFWMQLVLIKNILWFSHNKLDKHLISSKKDLSRVPMFVSRNGK